MTPALTDAAEAPAAGALSIEQEAFGHLDTLREPAEAATSAAAPAPEAIAPDEGNEEGGEPAGAEGVSDANADANVGADARAADARPADLNQAASVGDAQRTGQAPQGAPDAAPVIPFAFKAENQWRAVPGTAWDPQRGTITVDSPQALEQLQKYLGMGFKYEQVTKPELFQLRRQVQQLSTQAQAEVEQAKVYLQEWERMMELPEQELAAFILAARQEWPRIQAKAERAVAERLLEQARTAQAPPEPDVESIIDEARQGVAQLVQETLQGQPWASPAVAQELTEYLQDLSQMDQWVLRAQRDFPEMGVRAGQYVANWDAARQMLDRLTAGYRHGYAQLAQQQQQQAARVQQTTKVAAANAAAVAQAAGARPVPSRPAAAKAAPAGVKGQPDRSRRAQSKNDIIAEAFAQWRTMRTG